MVDPLIYLTLWKEEFPSSFDAGNLSASGEIIDLTLFQSEEVRYFLGGEKF